MRRWLDSVVVPSPAYAAKVLYNFLGTAAGFICDPGTGAAWTPEYFGSLGSFTTSNQGVFTTGTSDLTSNVAGYLLTVGVQSSQLPVDFANSGCYVVISNTIATVSVGQTWRSSIATGVHWALSDMTVLPAQDDDFTVSASGQPWQVRVITDLANDGMTFEFAAYGSGDPTAFPVSSAATLTITAGDTLSAVTDPQTGGILIWRSSADGSTEMVYLGRIHSFHAPAGEGLPTERYPYASLYATANASTNLWAAMTTGALPAPNARQYHTPKPLIWKRGNDDVAAHTVMAEANPRVGGGTANSFPAVINTTGGGGSVVRGEIPFIRTVSNSVVLGSLFPAGVLRFMHKGLAVEARP